MFDYLYKNICWNFRKDPFALLLSPSTTEEQYFEQLERIAEKYYPLQRQVEVINTEFCLNRLALTRVSDPRFEVAMGYFRQYWAQYVRLRSLFQKDFMNFPADTTATRIEHIAELISKCTQFALDDETLENIIQKTIDTLSMTEREVRYLEDAVKLFRIKYYCTACMSMSQKQLGAERRLAGLLQPRLLKHDFNSNKRYSRCAYSSPNVAAVVDCMGRSATRLGTMPTQVCTKLFVYSAGRNVLDTFVLSKFGERHAEFAAETRTIKVLMHYFVTDNGEVRNCTLYNKGKRCKFTVEIPVCCSSRDKRPEYFKMGDALCSASDIFSATAIMHDCNTIECYGERSRIFDIVLDEGECFRFDIVTLFADNTPALAQQLTDLQRFGQTRCPYLWDSACSRVCSDDKPIALTVGGHMRFRQHSVRTEQLHFTYQLGKDVATFIDNVGNSATLLGGFVFGVGGEEIFNVRQGILTKINEGNFSLDGDALIYKKKRTTLCITHDKDKIYRIESESPSRILFYFPLECVSDISFDRSNTFNITDGRRRYSIRFDGKVESFTTDALECAADRLRYKLSNSLHGDNCLAVCLAPQSVHTVTLHSAKEIPASSPMIRESLVSTYLNYVNDKNVFCLNHMLKKADSLTLTAICYTNPAFIRQYLSDIYSGQRNDHCFYDSTGVLQDFCDKLAAPLATIYYLNLVGELPKEWIQTVYDALLDDTLRGKDMCIRALALLNAAKLPYFDKVKCLVEYNRLKKAICSDSDLYAYAQAIGAVSMIHPSKERLKDLCNKYSIPKCWYYVSQLENLYGLNLSAGKLLITPKVTADNVLEQFALNICGKRIDTTFSKATVQCMTLNGQQCFSPFYAPSLTHEHNQLIVSY